MDNHEPITQAPDQLDSGPSIPGFYGELRRVNRDANRFEKFLLRFCRMHRVIDRKANIHMTYKRLLWMVYVFSITPLWPDPPMHPYCRCIIEPLRKKDEN